MNNKIDIPVQIHNTFDFVKRDAITNEIIAEYKAENIILNNFWALLLSSLNINTNNPMAYIRFGSGTTEPVASNVKLTTHVGYKAAQAHAAAYYDWSQYYATGVVSVRRSIRLEDTEYVGSVISEVGFSNTTSATTGLNTHALVKDSNGNTVSITKNSGEVLDIYGTFFVKVPTYETFESTRIFIPPMGKVMATMLFANSWISDGSCAYNVANLQLTGFSNAGRVDRLSISGGSIAFDVANKKATFTLPNAIASAANGAGGLQSLCVGGIELKVPCTGFAQPVLTKEVVGVGDGSNVDFRTDFGYILNNGTAKAYVDDVEVSATFDYGQLISGSEVSGHLKIIDWYKAVKDNTASGLLAQTLINYESSLFQGAANANNFIILENPWNSKMLITSMYGIGVTVYASNDLTNWYECGSRSTASSASFTINATYQGYRYFKITPYNQGSYAVNLYSISSTQSAALTNVHLAVAPTAGQTVAITYQPDCIAKDANHVLNNVSVAITFNEYTPS